MAKKNEKQRRKEAKGESAQSFLPIRDIRNGMVETTDGRYLKILEIEPINFALRSSEEQFNIISSFASWLKISPVRLQCKTITRRADSDKHIALVKEELAREDNLQCRALGEDYLRLIQDVGSREALTRRFFLIFQYEAVGRDDGDYSKIYSALQGAEQTARAYFLQCGTRAVGALFYPGGCYAVHNTRDAAMKWKGMGEFKALHSLTEIARLNGGVTHLDGALLFGKSYETALETLEASDPRHPELRFDSIYPHVHFLPLDDFGARLLGILTLPDWQERLLDLLFEPSTRTYGRGTMEYDAQVGAVKVLSHLDGDLARLLRFREGLWSHSGKFEVVCFPQQAGFVHRFLGDRVGVREISLEAVEKELLKGGDG